MDEKDEKKEEVNEESYDKESNKRNEKKNKESLTDRLRKNPWILSTIVLVILVIVLLFSGGNSNPGTGLSVNETGEALGLFDDDAVLGNLSAPVTIVEFSDYECPFCGSFYETTLKEIEREYINTGKVKIVFRDFPLDFHPSARKAAEAAECAGEQGKYWEMHNKLFENQNALSVENLKVYAKDIGLDVARFNQCLDSSAMADEVKKDVKDGTTLGVRGTPMFFINEKKISGAQSFSVFKSIIEEELRSV